MELPTMCVFDGTLADCKCHLRFMTTIERVALVTLACEGRQLCLAACPLLSCSATAISVKAHWV